MSSLLEQIKSQAGDKEGAERGIILVLIVSVLVSIAVALSLVWLNVERTKLAYRAHRLQRDVDRVLETKAKLEVERNFLISPQELSKKAEAMGLRPALPGEIRRMEPIALPNPAATDE